MKILLAQINPTIGDLSGNTDKILKSIEKAKKEKADIVVFPELAVSGYPPEDFLLLHHFAKAITHYLDKIVQATEGIIAIVGTPRYNPRRKEKILCNSAAIIENRSLIGFQDKTLLPTYDVFDERRYFEPAITNEVRKLAGKKVGITICEDIWQHSDMVVFTEYLHDPIDELKRQHPDLVINISSSPFNISKFPDRYSVSSRVATTLNCPVLFCNQVGGNDSLIFDGYSFYLGNDGQLLSLAKGFEEDYLLVDLTKKMSPISFKDIPIRDLYQALVLGLRDYFHKQGFKSACFGLSGGIDSAVVACIAAETLGKDNVLALIMSSRYSSKESVTDAMQLVKNLGIQYRQISIEEPFQSYLNILESQFEGKPFDATEENLQARIRGMILMAMSNKFGYIVLSTGNKSELAMGYATLYGDMCGGLGVISDVTKGKVYELARWINHKKKIIPQNILTKPPSAELRPNQKDSDALPPYEIIDNVLQAYVEEHKAPEEISEKFDYTLDVVNDIIKRIHRNEYKRYQSPPGLRVSQKAFSVGRRFPIVQKWV